MNTTLINTVKGCFLETFDLQVFMFFFPGRINIIGEHTDYNNGFVFPSAVNKGKDKLSPENY